MKNPMGWCAALLIALVAAGMPGAVAAGNGGTGVEGYFGAQLGPGTGGEGVAIVAALPGSPAFAAGFRKADRILRLDKLEPEGVQEAAVYLRAAGAGGNVLVTWQRGRKQRQTEITLSRNPWQGKDEPDPAPGLYAVSVETNIAYRAGRGADPRQHRLDLYAPISKVATPVLLWVHGGGWSLGNRETERALALRFAERGVAVAAMSYRLSASRWAKEDGTQSGVVHPAHVNDVADAFLWLLTNAPRLNLDRSALFVGGHSAGGHLAALLASDPGYLNARGVPVGAIAGALPIGGAYDIPDYHKALLGGDAALAEAHIRAVFGKAPDMWRAASPTEYLAQSAVPMLVIVEDQQGFQRYARQLKKAARKARRNNIEFLDARDRTHGNVLLLMSGRHQDEVRARMLDFMHETRTDVRIPGLKTTASATRTLQPSARTSATSARRETS